MDIPAHIPRRPNGSINVEQLEREFRWNRHDATETGNYRNVSFAEHLRAVQAASDRAEAAAPC